VFEKFLLGVSLFSLALSLFVLSKKEKNWAVTSAALACWFASSNLYKALLIQGELDSPVNLPAYAWVWQAISLLSCVAVCQFVSRKHWVKLLFLLQVGMSGLLLLDRLYERYFDDIPGLYLMTQISQAKAVIPSAIELLRLRDLAFVFDIVLACPLLFLGAPMGPVRKRLLPVLLFPLLLATFMTLTMDSEVRRILRLRFRNVAAVQKLGLIHYHAYDGLQIIYSRWDNVLNPNYDEKALRQLVLQSRRSIQAESPWKGRYKGKNLLIFQLESVEAFVLDLKVDGQEVTPFLNQLARRSWSGGLQDQSGQGRSSDGEFILLNSLLPPGERPLVYAYPSNYYCGLPALMAQSGYYTSYAVAYYGSFWNSRYMAKRYGFVKNLFREQLPNDPERTIGWGLNDEGLVHRLQAYWDKFPRPFFAYTVTMMGHHPYRELRRDQEQLRLSPRFNNTMLGRYLQLCRERDSEWASIVTLLRQKGLWDNSVVVLVGDHDARIPYEEMSLLNPKGRFDEVDKIEQDRVFCLIHGPDGKLRGKAPAFAAQIDLTPTLLHLMGVTDRPTATLGQNLLLPIQRQAVVSKSGYAIDADFVSIDKGGTWDTYSRSSHTRTQGQKPASEREMHLWYDLTRDLLRLNLVKTMLQMSDGSP